MLLLLLALPVLPIPVFAPPDPERFNGPLPQPLPPPPLPPFVRGDGDPIWDPLPFPLRLLAWRWRDGEAGTPPPPPKAMLPVLWKVPLWMAARVGEEGPPGVFLSRRLVSLRCCHCMSDSSMVLRYSRPLYLRGDKATPCGVSLRPGGGSFQVSEHVQGTYYSWKLFFSSLCGAITQAHSRFVRSRLLRPSAEV